MSEQLPRIVPTTFRERLRALGAEAWYDAQPLQVRLMKRGQTSSAYTLSIPDHASCPQVLPLPLAWSVN